MRKQHQRLDSIIFGEPRPKIINKTEYDTEKLRILIRAVHNRFMYTQLSSCQKRMQFYNRLPVSSNMKIAGRVKHTLSRIIDLEEIWHKLRVTFETISLPVVGLPKGKYSGYAIWGGDFMKFEVPEDSINVPYLAIFIEDEFTHILHGYPQSLVTAHIHIQKRFKRHNYQFAVDALKTDTLYPKSPHECS